MNKKAVFSELAERILWIIFFVAAAIGVGYLLNTILSG